MKKYIALIIAIASITYAADQTFSLTAGVGNTTTSITNTTPNQIWYLKSVYGVSGATNDTITLYKVSDSTNIPILSDAIGESTAVQITVPSTVFLSPGEIMVIGRTLTNTTLKGFVVTDSE